MATTVTAITRQLRVKRMLRYDMAIPFRDFSINPAMTASAPEPRMFRRTELIVASKNPGKKATAVRHIADPGCSQHQTSE